MEIQAHDRLKGLTPKVESELEKTLQERKNLGLSVPQKFNTLIKFYNNQGGFARAIPTTIPTISINIAPITSSHLNAEDNKRLGATAYYFDIARDYLINLDEELIFSMINSPQKTILQFEKCFSEDGLKERKKIFEERGVSCKTYERFLIEHAGPTKETIEYLLPKMKKTFNAMEIPFLRHEIDHVDFFTAQIYLDCLSISKEIMELCRQSCKDNSLSVEYVKANMECLETMTKIQPILEARALFFDYIKPGEWCNINFDNAKKDVYDNFVSSYIEDSYVGNTLDKLISVKWSENQMDRQTSNYLFKEVLTKAKNPNADRYVVDESRVNYDVANQILKQELPRWQNKFKANAKIAVEAIGNAYRDNPSKLSAANSAKTFQEYINLCKS